MTLNDNFGTYLSKLTESYGKASEAGDHLLGKLEVFADHSEDFFSNILLDCTTCLICIEDIENEHAIWSCTKCFCSFHISCIQLWAKECIYRQTSSENDLPSTKFLNWNCPKCRGDYKQTEIPSQYLCYCTKQADPASDPWLLPHSCGQVCGRHVLPVCGHSCLLLCHPGACPPCPQLVYTSCYCGRSEKQPRRCANKLWSCRKLCGRVLNCGDHKCKMPCHTGPCPVCPKTSQQRCECGRSVGERPCASPAWHCQTVCGRPLACGHHRCELVCHGGACPPCPKSLARHCPCGKTAFTLPCTEEIPTCEETCDRLLECGAHRCGQRCHRGECGLCREMVDKACRCGQRHRLVQCFKPYLCDAKCNRMRPCGRHLCKRRCCTGHCGDCDLLCGRQLSCKNHRCEGRCHTGPCYPCPKRVKVACACGHSQLSVPCGRERHTRPPRCSQPCRKPIACDHERPDTHRCHFGDCPPCRLLCDKLLTCGHRCRAVCHSAVKVQIQDTAKRAGPWEQSSQPVIQTVNQPCPGCTVPLTNSCLGGHETVIVACSERRSFSCGRPCGRTLACSNHRCSLECHLTVDPDADAHNVASADDTSSTATGCEQCLRPCSRARPAGCEHRCVELCHPGPCEPCRQMHQLRCHCASTVKYFVCSRWTVWGADKKRAELCCPGRCTKLLSCGHQCPALCHAGDCPPTAAATTTAVCKQKVELRCGCLRQRRQRQRCLGEPKRRLPCDQECAAYRDLDQSKPDNDVDGATSNTAVVPTIAEEKSGSRPRRMRRDRRQRYVEPSSFEKLSKWLRKQRLNICGVVAIGLISALFAYIIRTS